MIEFDHLSKSYGDDLALVELTLSIGRGETVALLGPNGSGKTTALKAAAGLIRPTAGAVLIDGENVIRPSARQKVSYLPQRVDFVDSLTGHEVVEFYRRLRGADKARTAEVLRMVSLNGAASRRTGTYSVGMLQRLGLAVNAVAGAPVLLLDEPTASLDPEGLDAFYAMVEQRQRAGGVVFFSSHQLGDAERLADRFAILVAGRLVAVFSRDALAQRLASRGVLRVRVAGREQEFHAKAEERPAILEKIRAEGRVIESIVTEEGRLDDLYDDLVTAERVGGAE